MSTKRINLNIFWYLTSFTNPKVETIGVKYQVTEENTLTLTLENLVIERPINDNSETRTIKRQNNI